ncbi:hypothetical protein [Mycobacterium servetii]|uniref:Low molecular weight antigen MTB12-like C-terminal domain-containing protein n=1 Tax=Mycobacterium servetii TaxID=3237418 RepID=A0ABV4C376_9MYCO
MRRQLCVALATVAAFGLSACSPSKPTVSLPPSSRAAPASPTSPPAVVAPPAVPLPAPPALTDVLSRLADPNVPAAEKVNLIEGATPENAGTLEKFTTALRDNGYLPMTFAANDIAWSDKNPSNVKAMVTVNTAKADNGNFTFPMEFTPSQDGWQLSRRTAEMLLALGKSSAPTASAPPAPPPAQAPAPAPPR